MKRGVVARHSNGLVLQLFFVRALELGPEILGLGHAVDGVRQDLKLLFVAYAPLAWFLVRLRISYARLLPTPCGLQTRDTAE